MKFSTFEMVFKIIGFQVTDQSPTGENHPVARFRALLRNMEDFARKPARRQANPSQSRRGPPELLTVHILKRRTGAGGGLLGVEVSAIFAAAWFLLAILNLSNLSAPRGLILVFISSMSLNPPLLFLFFLP